MDDERKQAVPILLKALEQFMELATDQETIVLAGLIDLQARKMGFARRAMRQDETPEALAAWRREFIDDYARVIDGNVRALDAWYQFETQGGQTRH